MPLSLGDVEVTIGGFQLSGWFAADGSSINDLEVIGLMDTRPIDTAFGQDVCTLASIVGDKCIACPDGKVECLELNLTSNAPGEYDAGVSIDRSYDPSADPDCE